MNVPTLPEIAGKVSSMKRTASVVVKPPLVQIREGWYTGADVRVSSSATTKVEVVARIPIEERSAKIMKQSAVAFGILFFLIAVFFAFDAREEMSSIRASARQEVMVAKATIFMLVGAPIVGGLFGSIAAAVATTLMGASPQMKEKNRKWAKDLEDYLNRSL